MNLKTYREKALPLIGLAIGPRFEAEARQAHRGERGTDELCVVAQWAGPKLVGICGLGQETYHYPQKGKAGPAVWLAYFAVHPDYRGRGIGRTLLAKTEQLAREQGYEWMLVETYTTATFWNARQLYAKAGYSLIGQEHQTLAYRKRLI